MASVVNPNPASYNSLASFVDKMVTDDIQPPWFGKTEQVAAAVFGFDLYGFKKDLLQPHFFTPLEQFCHDFDARYADALNKILIDNRVTIFEAVVKDFIAGFLGGAAKALGISNTQDRACVFIVDKCMDIGMPKWQAICFSVEYGYVNNQPFPTAYYDAENALAGYAGYPKGNPPPTELSKSLSRLYQWWKGPGDTSPPPGGWQPDDEIARVQGGFPGLGAAPTPPPSEDDVAWSNPPQPFDANNTAVAGKLSVAGINLVKLGLSSALEDPATNPPIKTEFQLFQQGQFRPEGVSSSWWRSITHDVWVNSKIYNAKLALDNELAARQTSNFTATSQSSGIAPTNPLLIIGGILVVGGIAYYIWSE